MADLEITDASANAGPSTSTTPAKPHIDDHKPNPKVAVAVAGAAVSTLVVTELWGLPARLEGEGMGGGCVGVLTSVQVGIGGAV